MLGEPDAYLTDNQEKLIDLNLVPPLAKELGKVFEVDAHDIQTVNV